MAEKWYVLREDQGKDGIGNIFRMNVTPYKTAKAAQSDLDTFLDKQEKPHHQDYWVDQDLPKDVIDLFSPEFL